MAIGARRGAIRRVSPELATDPSWPARSSALYPRLAELQFSDVALAG